MAIFAGAALGLAAIGIYGVIAYASAQRLGEVATRMALGATPGNVFWLMMNQGRNLSLLGIVAGLAAGGADQSRKRPPAGLASRFVRLNARPIPVARNLKGHRLKGVQNMARPFRPVAGPAVIMFLSAALLSLTAAAQTSGAPERYTAAAINMNNGSAGNINIAVNRWSTAKERDALMSVMLKEGPEKLLDALQDTRPVGNFGMQGNLSWDLRFAMKNPLPDGGERVVLITDRRLGFWEVANRPRSFDYPFTVIELRLNADGEGEGKMSVAARVISDKENNMITLENYDLQPVQLANVRRERVRR